MLGNDKLSAMSTSLVAADDPRVVEAVDAAAEKAKNFAVEITQEMFMEALKSGIDSSEAKRRQDDPKGAQ